MVNIMMGPEGSGKTKLLIGALNQAVQRESGSIVCIEKGDTLRFDVDHKVRLIGIRLRRLSVPARLYQRPARGKL